MKKLNPLYLFFILVYANEGLYHLSGQPIYYLQREIWKLDATTMGWIGFFSSLPWCIKILFGFIGDKYPCKNKDILIANYILGVMAYLYIIIFGLTPISLTITGFLISFYVAFSDTLKRKANGGRRTRREPSRKMSSNAMVVLWGCKRPCFSLWSLVSYCNGNHTGY